ncbi:MAG: hypothetical protein JJ916_08490 [Phycisphaerales bacterium]|nr:hypothetical protein [Phycisphaerales bacterium]
MLVGCLTVLGIVIVILIIATVFVVRSWRGWTAGWVESGVDAVLVEINIDESEKGEVLSHVNTLMTRFKDKDIGFEELKLVLESVAESPLMGAAIIGGVDAIYFKESGLSDEEKADGRLQLARYAQGLREKSIDPDTLESVLDSVSTATPDNDDIQINIPEALNITLRSADEVSDDDLRAVFAEAKAKADEAEIEATPVPIDISDELGVAIANALGEDPSEWVPGYTLPEAVVDTEVIEDSGASEETGTDADEGP